MENLKELLNKLVTVVTLEGRTLVGTLKGFDNKENLILGDTHERVFSSAVGCEREPLGLFIVRGDSVALIGELDEVEDAEIDWTLIRGDQLSNVSHGTFR